MKISSEINPPLQDEGKNKNECHQCYIDADDNVQKVIECTEKYLPEEYMECWNKKHSNDSVKAELNIMRCFKARTFFLSGQKPCRVEFPFKNFEKIVNKRDFLKIVNLYVKNPYK